MRRAALLAPLLLAALASAAPPDAAKLLADARAQAKREGKSVMVVFHASWCGWCKKFDRMLTDPKVGPLVGKSYVVVHLDVLEAKDKKADLENPGGEATMEALGGKNAGLPFFAVVDPTGKKLGDSLMEPGKPSTNTGHPAKPEEIAHFLDLLRATAKRTDAKGRDAIRAYLQADAAQGH